MYLLISTRIIHPGRVILICLTNIGVVCQGMHLGKEEYYSSRVSFISFLFFRNSYFTISVQSAWYVTSTYVQQGFQEKNNTSIPLYSSPPSNLGQIQLCKWYIVLWNAYVQHSIPYDLYLRRIWGYMRRSGYSTAGAGDKLDNPI